MAVEKHERTLAEILGNKNFPRPARFKSLKPRSLSWKADHRWQEWDPNTGQQTRNQVNPGTVSWMSVTSDSRVGDFRNPTYHDYVVEVNRQHQGWAVTRSTNGTLRGRREGPFYQVEGSGVLVGYSYPTLSQFDATVSNNALEKLNEKTRGSVDLSIDLMQSRQGLNMVKSLGQLVRGVTSLNNALRNPFGVPWRIIERDPKRFRKFGYYQELVGTKSKVAAERWLEWQYGVRPAASTLFESVEKLLDRSRGYTRRFVTHARKQLESVPDWSIVCDGVTARGLLKVHGVVGARYDILFHDQDPGWAEFSSLNPVSIAWETLPFSFVADWVLDIGSYLRNLETAYLYDNRFKGGTLTQYLAADFSWEVTGTNNFGPYYRTVSYSGSSEWRRRRRSVLGTYPRPQLPSFDVKLGSQRLLSAAALLRGMLK